LEILSQDRDEKILKKYRKLLLDLLKKLGIAKDMIEARPYTELLSACAKCKALEEKIKT